MYCDGIGVARDPAMGTHYYRRAAEGGSGIAQLTLGKLYLDASAQPEDREQARYWLGRAAEQGDGEARRHLATLDAEPAPADGNAEASSSPERLAQLGPQDMAGQFLLGQRLASGDGVARNDREAVRWLALAADRGHVAAQYALSRMIDAGRGVPRNIEEVLRLLRCAAGAGHADAQFELGVLHGRGDGVPRNQAIARAWFRKAAARGHLKALRKLERRSWWRVW
jgi:TPR repeat protein